MLLPRGDMPWATGKAAHWRGDRTRTTLWEIANNNPFGNQNHAQSWGHGTQKPVECMRRPIVNNSRPGQAIYDPFLGSGTSLIAAEMSARICYGLELNPVYVDVIVRRPQLFTGRAALHHFWQSFFLTGHPVLATLWGPIVGPLVAVISFVCSVGNIPLAAVLWNGSISFGGVVAFIFADLIPEVGASLSLDQLRGDAHSPAGLAHRALEQIAHAQLRTIRLTSTACPLYAKLELAAMTNSQRMRASAVIISSTMPSVKYSCSGSPLRFWNGNTAIDGLSGKASGAP